MPKLPALLLLAACGACQAITTTYAWYIDWETSPDESGQFDFDDLNRDLSMPALRFDQPHYSGSLPSSYGYFRPWFQGRTLVGVNICDELDSWCSDSSTIPGWGYTKSSFNVFGPSNSTRARFDMSAGCSGGGFTARCFDFEPGQTTFTAIASHAPEPETYALMLLGLGLIALRIKSRL